MSIENKRWSRISEADGIITFRLTSWSDFFDFLESEVFSPESTSKKDYIWRGQRRSDWSLSTSLDRLFADLDLLKEAAKELERRAAEHLQAFKYAARGRRGRNPARL